MHRRAVQRARQYNPAPATTTARTVSSRSPSFQTTLVVLVALAAGLAGAFAWRFFAPQTQPAAEKPVFLAYPEPRPVADFALTGADGEPFSLADLRGSWTLAFFGFASCPDICPTALQLMARLAADLETAGAPATPTLWFVSVDPERDTPERMASYVSYFHPDFVAATGPDAQLRALALQLGVTYAIEDHEPGAEYYDVSHSGGILLLNPQGRLVGLYPPPHDPTAMADDLARRLAPVPGG
jgi:protein SCO1/2